MPALLLSSTEGACWGNTGEASADGQDGGPALPVGLCLAQPLIQSQFNVVVVVVVAVVVVVVVLVAVVVLLIQFESSYLFY
ncbi:hypothetical protein ElyMa_004680400 [Elysia marginata]|uniref:Uncharacterized protein n=1 Tax=Elysia marginata TaxID=1093978 RepID=A0AAV4I766_9GAST|nr:hypothetical protein ElyMa_004680400 [Elysia marginata]